MDATKFNAVFVTGLVRNNTTRYTLDEKILERYKTCCEKLLQENEQIAAHFLYDNAAFCLKLLLNDPEADVPVVKVKSVRV